MSDEAATDSRPFEGNMFLYEQPVLLNKEEHGSLGLSTLDRPFDFVKSIKGVPLVAGEIQSAQKHYPIVFSDFENPVLVAIVGIIDDVNIFVDEAGNWDNQTYIPSYLRCHPFAFAKRPDDEMAVVIDRASSEISEKPDMPFFDGDEMSADTRKRVDFCMHYNDERRRTQEFCQKVKELGLLNGQRINKTMSDGTEVKIADYVSIDPTKLTELDKDTLQELHKDGSLAAIFAQLFSLENWNRLIMRRTRQQDAS
jgi:hypothetical protein